MRHTRAPSSSTTASTTGTPRWWPAARRRRPGRRAARLHLGDLLPVLDREPLEGQSHLERGPFVALDVRKLCDRLVLGKPPPMRHHRLRREIAYLLRVRQCAEEQLE